MDIPTIFFVGKKCDGPRRIVAGSVLSLLALVAVGGCSSGDANTPLPKVVSHPKPHHDPSKPWTVEEKIADIQASGGMSKAQKDQAIASVRAGGL